MKQCHVKLCKNRVSLCRVHLNKIPKESSAMHSSFALLLLVRYSTGGGLVQKPVVQDHPIMQHVSWEALENSMHVLYMSNVGNGQLSLTFGVPNFCGFWPLILCLLKPQVETKRHKNQGPPKLGTVGRFVKGCGYEEVCNNVVLGRLKHMVVQLGHTVMISCNSLGSDLPKAMERELDVCDVCEHIKKNIAEAGRH